MVVSAGAGLFVERAGGLDSSCAVNAFGVEATLTIVVVRILTWGEVRCRELSHEELAN